ncbi:MAG TPA: FecR family protein [Pyrinomonadaceae bacterium]|nr:FecR family protein [Pyrinomonadaceae bacterium]
MKSRTISMICSALLILGVCALAGQAQNRERFTISAKAGGVNAVSGQVMVRRVGQGPQLLTSQDDLASGDVVNTGQGSQAEILLNPGTYLRLAEDSEFEMVDNSLDNLLVKLNKGSAIIEATGPEQIELRIPIITEQKRMTIVRAGIYRINVRPGVTELFVRKGRMSLGTNRDDIVKSGKKMTFSSGGQSIAKLTDADKDQFDDWSKLRGQTLAKANLKLSARALNGYLTSSAFSSPFGRFGRWGLWTWSPFSSCYTFLPFYGGWGSPYGSFYGLFAPGYYGYPGYYQGNRTYNPTIVTNSSSSGSSSSSSGGPTWSTAGSGPSSGSSGGSTGGSIMSAPASHSGSQAGPRDPDSGSRSVNRIKDPIN